MLLNTIAEDTLENGLKVLALKKPGTPVAAVQLWYKTGSVAEHDGVRGIAHVLEHMMFRGSTNFKSEEHAQKINGVGGHCNAFTTEDMTVYTNSVPVDFCSLIFELESDRMEQCTIRGDLFETERKVIIEEYHLSMNNPISKAFLEFRQEFFRDHPYSTGPLGLLSDLESMTAGDCMNYYKKWYTPGNAVLVVVADMDAKKVFAMVRNYFSKINGIPIVKQPPIPDSDTYYKRAAQNVRMKRIIDFDVPLLVLGYPAPPSYHKDAVALEVLQMITAGGDSSKLHREVVRRQSIAVMAGGMNHLLKHAGMSMFMAAFTPDISANRVEAAMLKIVNDVRRGRITEPDINKVKNAILTNRTFELYSAENICQRIGYGECVEGNYRNWVKRIEELKKIDAQVLVKVAQKYWDDSGLHVLHLQPRKVNPLLYAAGFLSHITRKLQRK